MKAREFVRNLQVVPMDPRESALIARLIFQSMADCLYDLELADGRPLKRCDVIGVKEFLRELVEAAQIAGSTEGQSAPESRTGLKVIPRSNLNLDFCPDCGHIHVEDDECGFPIGGGRICRCERAVPA